VWMITEVSVGNYDWKVVARYVLTSDEVQWVE